MGNLQWAVNAVGFHHEDTETPRIPRGALEFFGEEDDVAVEEGAEGHGMTPKRCSVIISVK